jgi:hypothetical protein
VLARSVLALRDGRYDAYRPNTVNENFMSILSTTITILPGTNMLIPRFSRFTLITVSDCVNGIILTVAGRHCQHLGNWVREGLP